MSSRAAEWRVRLGMILISSGLALLVLEVAARILLSPAVNRGVAGTPISETSKTLGWRTRPGGSQRIVREDFDVTVSLNTHGLRGPDLDYGKSAGRRRLVIAGDSFAHGYYAPEEETLAGRLRGSLTACGVDVVNGGGPGYSTDQEWLYFSEELARYEPSEVLLLFYYNDLLFNIESLGTANRSKPMFREQDGKLTLVPPAFSAESAPPPAASVAAAAPSAPRFHGSALWSLVASRVQRTRPDWSRRLSTWGLAPEISLEPPAEFLPFGPKDGAERARVEAMWRMTERLLAAFRDDVRARGAGFSVLYVPARFEVNDEAWRYLARRYEGDRPWRRDAVYSRLSGVLAGLGIPLIDSNAAFAEAEASKQAAYLPVDGHWNSRGNEIAFRATLPVMARAYGCAR